MQVLKKITVPLLSSYSSVKCALNWGMQALAWCMNRKTLKAKAVMQVETMRCAACTARHLQQTGAAGAAATRASESPREGVKEHISWLPATKCILKPKTTTQTENKQIKWGHAKNKNCTWISTIWIPVWKGFRPIICAIQMTLTKCNIKSLAISLGGSKQKRMAAFK